MRRVMFLALFFAVPILLLGIDPASACCREYAYGYGGCGYSSVDPFVARPIARPMPVPVAVGVAGVASMAVAPLVAANRP